MREISFRAWHEGTKVMFYPVHNAQLFNLVPFCDFVVEQFTGIKDKNGVKIYEGDILKAKSNKMEFKGYVKYACELGAYWLHDNNGSLDFLSGFSELEIIGNKFENPELLEK